MIEVLSGWRRFRETNTVIYDPARITVEEMVRILKEVKTYRGTVE